MDEIELVCLGILATVGFFWIEEQHDETLMRVLLAGAVTAIAGLFLLALQLDILRNAVDFLAIDLGAVFGTHIFVLTEQGQ